MDITDELKDFGQITLTINSEGELKGSIRWYVEEDTDPEHGQYMVEALHGMFAALLNDPDYVTEIGAAFLLGATSNEIDDDSIEFTPEGIDKEDSSEQDEFDLKGKIVSFTPSNRKH